MNFLLLDKKQSNRNLRELLGLQHQSKLLSDRSTEYAQIQRDISLKRFVLENSITLRALEDLYWLPTDPEIIQEVCEDSPYVRPLYNFLPLSWYQPWMEEEVLDSIFIRLLSGELFKELMQSKAYMQLWSLEESFYDRHIRQRLLPEKVWIKSEDILYLSPEEIKARCMGSPSTHPVKLVLPEHLYRVWMEEQDLEETLKYTMRVENFLEILETEQYKVLLSETRRWYKEYF